METEEKVPGEIVLISRRRYAKAGSRYLARGADDYGNVANFVETEQQFRCQGETFSVVQIRGSVPLFWQQGEELSTELVFHKTAGLSKPVFRKHFSEILKEYGSTAVINLLDESKPGEKKLLEAFESAIKKLQSKEKFAESTFLKYAYFDYHSRCKGGVFGCIFMD